MKAEIIPIREEMKVETIIMEMEAAAPTAEAEVLVIVPTIR